MQGFTTIRPRPEILDDAQIAALLAPSQLHPAWEVHFYLGSLLAIQLGPKITGTTLRGDPLVSGLTALSFRASPWAAIIRSRTMDSEYMDAEDKVELRDAMIGHPIRAVTFTKPSVSVFIGAVELRLDFPADDEFEFEIALPTGEILQLVPEKGVFLGTKVSDARRAATNH